MSQRSHIAHSGSSAMSAVLGGVERAEELRHLLEPVELRGLGQNQIASVSKVVSGMSSGTTSIVAAVATALRA